MDKTATSSDDEDDGEEARAAGVMGGEGRAGPREQRSIKCLQKLIVFSPTIHQNSYMKKAI